MTIPCLRTASRAEQSPGRSVVSRATAVLALPLHFDTSLCRRAAAPGLAAALRKGALLCRRPSSQYNAQPPRLRTIPSHRSRRAATLCRRGAEQNSPPASHATPRLAAADQNSTPPPPARTPPCPSGPQRDSPMHCPGQVRPCRTLPLLSPKPRCPGPVKPHRSLPLLYPTLLRPSATFPCSAQAGSNSAARRRSAALPSGANAVRGVRHISTARLRPTWLRLCRTTQRETLPTHHLTMPQPGVASPRRSVVTCCPGLPRLRHTWPSPRVSQRPHAMPLRHPVVLRRGGASLSRGRDPPDIAEAYRFAA